MFSAFFIFFSNSPVLADKKIDANTSSKAANRLSREQSPDKSKNSTQFSGSSSPNSGTTVRSAGDPAYNFGHSFLGTHRF